MRAREALPTGGSVLDVGCGAGAASLPLASVAHRIVGVDESAELLDAFGSLAASRAATVETVHGRWPDVANDVPGADVVLCHHVLYNVPDFVPFVDALAGHARRRVVVELTEAHPLVDLAPLWRHFHGIDRPRGPTAADAARLLRAMGAAVTEEHTTRPAPWAPGGRAERVAFARRRLCLGPERDAEIDSLLETPDRRLVTLWWDAG